MVKEFLLVTVIALLLNLAIAPSVLASDGAESAEFARKVKSEVARLGTGPKAKITAVLKDGKKLKGYISESGEDEFIVKGGENDADSSVAYASVKELKGKRSIGGIAKPLIILGIVLAVTVIVVAIKYKNAANDRTFP